MKSCAKYPAGSLRQVVTIQAKTRATDNMGGFTETWAAVSGAPTRAMITAAPGAERFAAMRQGSGNTLKMVTRWFATATAAQRVIWNAKEYAVLGVIDPDGKGDWLEWQA